MAPNTKAVGDIGEQLAAEYLEKNGYKILERNAIYCGCEADIICECFVDGNDKVIKPRGFFNSFKRKSGSDCERVLVFCEVKTRCGGDFGTGAEAVTAYKAGRYVTAAKAYCSQHFCADARVRFDIIEICGDFVNQIVNAFGENDAKYLHRT